MTIDELIGYAPQLSKEQIQNLYQRFGKDFAMRPFEEVMNETQVYVKRYYSCYPFLLQMCILWLNHFSMADTKEKQKDICLRIEKLCVHIREHCKNVKINEQVVLIQSPIYFQTGHIQEVVEELEELSSSDNFDNQSMILLARAYAMLGNKEKADSCSQISMYESIMNLLAGATCYLMVHTRDLSVCEETIRRMEHVAEVYKIARLNPNNLSAFEYQAAVCYLAHGEKQKALEHIEQYVVCLLHLFSATDLQLHGDAYFNKAKEWFANELPNGTNAPRHRKVVLEDAKKTLDVPPFTVLNGIPEFEKIKSKLKEIN